MGEKYKEEDIYLCICVVYFAVLQRLIQNCGAIPIKINLINKIKISSGTSIMFNYLSQNFKNILFFTLFFLIISHILFQNPDLKILMECDKFL